MILMFIGIGIGSVSADMKKILSAIYRIGRFEKWDLSVLIGIGRYEKKLIGRTLITFYVVTFGFAWRFAPSFDEQSYKSKSINISGVSIS